MSTWTDKRIKLLREYWSAGYSCSQIAYLINEATPEARPVSRNAVISKRIRVGLPDRETQAMRRAKASRSAQSSRWRAVLNPKAVARAREAERFRAALPPEPEPTEEPHVRSLLDLEDIHCRYPIGDPQSSAFGFCGAKKSPGLPYCEKHARVCYESVRLASRRQEKPREVEVRDAAKAESEPDVVGDV